MKIHCPEKIKRSRARRSRFTPTRKLKDAEQRDGHYLLRSNLTAEDPAVLWTRYVQLTQIEAVFRSLKSELGIRPIYHQLEHRADAHMLIAFLAYCLQVTLKHHLRAHAPGLTPATVLEKLATIQMIDVCIPTTDGRWLILPRYTQPDTDTKMLLLEKLRLELPSQPPPRLTAAKREQRNRGPDGLASWPVCGGDLSITSTDSKALNWTRSVQLRKIG